MAIRQYKTDFIRQQLQRNKNNPRKFWDNIRELLPNAKDNTIKSLYDQPSDKTIDKNELPMYINSFFTSIGENLARPLLKYKSQTNDVPGADIDLEIQLEQQESLTKVISVEEVKLFVDTIDTAKSAGMQNMKTMILKDAFQAKPEYLCKVFNSSLQKCQFPVSWKKSNIVPLPKVPNVKVANDLRPISLLPLPGKVLEKIMCKRLNAFLENNRIISDKQHGFRKQRSTITSITALLDQVYLNLNNSQPTYMAFLDLRKAFDSVSHPRLLDKLKEIGLSEQMVEWCKNYLTERKQRVICGELKSEYQNVVYGVPQGSVLGPILFNIYINKLPNIAGDNIQMYADDAVVFDTDPLELQQKLNYIVTWFNQNMLTLNVNKTQWLSVGPQRNTHNVRLFAGNVQLDRVGSYKYLGLEIDTNLDYHLHRQKLIGNVHSKINYLTTIRSFLTTSAALTIYKSTILPLINYCDFVYDQNISYTNQQIQKLQNRALRVVFNQHRIRYDLRLSTDTLHERAKISRLIYRRYQHLLIYGHYLCETPAHIDGRNLPTRAHLGLKLRTITVKNNKCYRSIYNRAAEAWNKLDLNVRNIRDRDTFKNTIVRMFGNRYTEN